MNSFFVDPDISIAKTIDKRIYEDAETFELCKEKLFVPSWQLIGSSELVEGNENVYPFTLLEDSLNEPLVLVRDKEGKLHCLSNVCTHRGNLMAAKKCKAQQLVCKYHGRRFELNGKFLSMPEFKEVKNFPSESDHLKSLSLYQWGKILFTSLHPNIKAEEIFGEIRKRLDWFPMDKLVLDEKRSKDYTIHANWALYCENYLEGFHIPFVHAGLNDVLDFGEYTTELFRWSNLQIGIASDGDICFDLPPSSPDHGKKIAGYYFWAFPNLMLNFYPWGLSVNIMKPISVNECKVSYLIYVCDESKLNSGAGGDLHTVEMEDEEIVENVQKGVKSRFYSNGRYSVTRETGTHHFHLLLSEKLK